MDFSVSDSKGIPMPDSSSIPSAPDAPKKGDPPSPAPHMECPGQFPGINLHCGNLSGRFHSSAEDGRLEL